MISLKFLLNHTDVVIAMIDITPYKGSIIKDMLASNDSTRWNIETLYFSSRAVNKGRNP